MGHPDDPTVKQSRKKPDDLCTRDHATCEYGDARLGAIASITASVRDPTAYQLLHRLHIAREGEPFTNTGSEKLYQRVQGAIRDMRQSQSSASTYLTFSALVSELFSDENLHDMELRHNPDPKLLSILGDAFSLFDEKCSFCGMSTVALEYDQLNRWFLFNKIVNQDRHHIRPTSTSKFEKHTPQRDEIRPTVLVSILLELYERVAKYQNSCIPSDSPKRKVPFGEPLHLIRQMWKELIYLHALQLSLTAAPILREYAFPDCKRDMIHASHEFTVVEVGAETGDLITNIVRILKNSIELVSYLLQFPSDDPKINTIVREIFGMRVSGYAFDVVPLEPLESLFGDILYAETHTPRRQKSITVQPGDIRNLPGIVQKIPEGEPVDVFLFSNVCHKVTLEDLHEILRNAYELLPSLGRLVVIAPFWSATDASRHAQQWYMELDHSEHKESIIPIETWETITDEAGFRLIKIKDIGYQGSVRDGFAHFIGIWEKDPSHESKIDVE